MVYEIKEEFDMVVSEKVLILVILDYGLREENL